MGKAVGTSPVSADMVGKVRGTCKYPQDFSMEDQLWVSIVWPQYPHAVVRKIDTSEAEAVSGVIQVITSKDVPVNNYGILTSDQPVLVEEGGRVRWVGDRIALVVAEDRRIARRARDLVRVQYEPLPVVTDPRSAMCEDSPLVQRDRPRNILHHRVIRKGDVERGFVEAEVVIEGEVSTPVVEHMYMQPEAGIGYIDEQGRVTVIASAQWPHDDRRQIAHILNLRFGQVREIVPAVGGAFGGREDMFVQHLLALAAFVVRHPVKMVWDRQESMVHSGKRHPFHFRYKAGATRAGLLTAVQIDMISDAGAYASTSSLVLDCAATFAVGPYKVPHVLIEARTVHTNNAFTMAMRGFGSTQSAMLHESYMDRLAEVLNIDPVELRLQNLLDDGDVAATGNAMWGGVGIKETLRQAALAAGWSEQDGTWHRPDLGQPGDSHHRRGIGVACAYKNVGYTFGAEDESGVEVILELAPDGSIAGALIKTGVVDMGQGATTALAQIAAEALDISFSRVRMSTVDTSLVPDGGSSSGSRLVYMTGNAVLAACRAALAKRDRVLRAETGEAEISGEAMYRGRSCRPTTPLDPETGQGYPCLSYSYGTQIALVEVNRETGETEILRMWAAHDAGRVINPAGHFGQVAGGIQMGVGYALMEEYIQTEAMPRTRRLSEYYLPTVLDMPRDLVSIPVQVEDPTGPFGAKGLGETPTLPTAPAIVNAIRDALGVRPRRIPATSEEIWLALCRKTEREPDSC
jgi:CO/xanthine dehydrogenase Mo-binding subunit